MANKRPKPEGADRISDFELGVDTIELVGNT